MNDKQREIKDLLVGAAIRLKAAEMFVDMSGIVKQLGEAQSKAIEIVTEARNQFEYAKIRFEETFKYPLEVFDLAKGEKPKDFEEVCVYDEKDKRWIRANRGMEDKFRNPLFEEWLPLDRYRRWTRLPVLEAIKQ